MSSTVSTSEHRARRQLAHRADDFGVAGMADQDDGAPAPVMEFGLAMDFGDQRTGGVDGEQVAFGRRG